MKFKKGDKITVTDAGLKTMLGGGTTYTGTVLSCIPETQVIGYLYEVRIDQHTVDEFDRAMIYECEMKPIGVNRCRRV